MYSPCHIESSGWCADQQALQRGEKNPNCLFANFHGVNIPTVANFKLLALSLNMGWGRDTHGKLQGASRSWAEHATSMFHCAVLRIYFYNYNSLNKVSLCTYVDGFRVVSQPCCY